MRPRTRTEAHAYTQARTAIALAMVDKPALKPALKPKFGTEDNMKLQQIGNKQAHILRMATSLGSESMILFSYETPVAEYRQDIDVLTILTTEGINRWLIYNGRETRKNFPTTTRHINEFKRILSDMQLLDSETTVTETNEPTEVMI